MERAVLEAELRRVLAAGLGWALVQTGWNRAEAEDVLQASVLKLLDGRARFDGRSSFRSFALGVIRRTAQERRRREQVRRLILMRPAARALEPVELPDASAARSSEAARLVAALSRLPARQREILHLVFYGELTIEEAALVAGVSLGTARTHYARGKQRLRELLGAEDRDERS